ncbi:MAG: hypothetical protein FJ254_08870 [Phycisphaerae bacterium]|nr:hypothetical protein [Phycisphaerae bacterium]
MMFRSREPSVPFTVRLRASRGFRVALWAAAATVAVLVAPVARADSAICGEVFVGDLNNDKKVTVADIAVFQQLRASGGYSPCADFTRDGILSDADGMVLSTLVDFATSPINGGGQFRVPCITLNEVRLGVSSSATPLQQRYIELRIPQDRFPSNYAWNGTLPAGYRLLIVGRNLDDQGLPDQGIILRSIDLTGLQFQRDGASAGYALVLQEQEVGTIPVYDLPTPNIPVLRTPELDLGAPSVLTVGNTKRRNLTVLLTYRRPFALSPEYVPVATEPDAGSDLDSGNTCRLVARQAPADAGPPPWDVIIDAVSLRRTLTSSDQYGCVFCPSPDFAVGPITAGDGGSEAPLHAWRCEGTSDQGQWRALIQEPAFGVDTPGSINRSCDATTAYCGQSGSGNCLSQHTTPACDEAACCSAVCLLDPACCTLSWDAGCVAKASTECLTCGGSGAGDCFSESGMPYCDDAACCGQVCAVDPTCCLTNWDSTCVQNAREECLQCGDPVGSCFVEHELPNCIDADCCATVCAIEPSCCNVTWDSPCVEQAIAECEELGCGAPNAGECCLSHPTPYCNDATCCELVCAADVFCCTVRWDLACALLASEHCTGISCVCGELGSGNCFDVHAGVGCSDQVCCDTVCTYDSYCCAVSWDAACVGGADARCAQIRECQGTPFDPVFGSCFVPHPNSTGCDDPNCCDETCIADPRCCDIGWDIVCAAYATANCNGCGDLLSGSCYSTHGLPTCSDAKCCQIVCAIDPFCCAEQWDGNCVQEATAGCSGAIEACGDNSLRSCFVASTAPACSDAACCNSICGTLDPYCCEVSWDAICVRMAVMGCDPPAGSEGGNGDCLSVHATRSCANEACAAAVCSVAPTCCQSGWDESCVDIALAICIAPNTCPGTGSCFTQHQSPGCDDSYCCNAVCSFDPDCCTNRWDGQCTSLADNLCEKQDQNWNCPCVGSCFTPHEDTPGCDESACCTAVCAQLPSCCTDGWDLACANLARSICCGTIGCASGCNGSCTVPHETPYCDDPYCCEAVCQTEPFCCEIAWDGLCSDLAGERCAQGCGSPDAPSCFTDHLTPGCSDFDCCRTVCEIDSYCCEFEWDPTCVDMANAKCNVPICGDDGLGDCCEPHAGPWCDDRQCCEVVCAQDQFCCEFEWDQTCVQLTYEFDTCGCRLECGDPCALTCCEAHFGPSCNDAECCNRVCLSDAYCCDTSWDESCASLALQNCYAQDEACPLRCGLPEAGSCCVQHPGGGCENKACCQSVCQVDFFCCQVQWDATCVDLAIKVCQTGLCDGESCGSPQAGSCFQERTVPYCNNFRCCNLVCSYEPHCCTTAWDATCVQFAEALCTAFTGDLPEPPPAGQKGNQFRGRGEGLRRAKPAGRAFDPKTLRGAQPAPNAPTTPVTPPPAIIKPGQPVK